MCGIVGVLGNHQVAPILVEALKRLEYRGYDSAGIATVHEGHLERRRAVPRHTEVDGPRPRRQDRRQQRLGVGVGVGVGVGLG